MPRSLLGKKLRTEGIAKRALGVEISAIKEMPLLADEIGAIRLDQGIPSFRTPRFVREYLAKAIMSVHDIGKYSQQPGMPRLKKAVSEDLHRRLGIDIDPDAEIFISVGSIEALDCAARTLIERGDEAVFFSPAYEPHINQVRFSEGCPVYIPLDEKRGWRPDIEALKKGITEKTKVIYICNPANPTGTVYTKEEIEDILKIAKQHNLFVISDEAYEHLVYDNKPYVSLLSYFPKMKDNILVSRTFSKMIAATGYRIGYMVADKGLMQHILKPHDAAAICAPVPSQYAALHALEHPEKTNAFVRYTRKRLRERRDLMCERLDRNPLRDVFQNQVPEGAYYVFPRIPTEDSYDFALKILYGAKVAGVPGDAFGKGGEGHIRFMFCATEKTISDAMDRIEQYVSSKEFASYMMTLKN